MATLSLQKVGPVRGETRPPGDKSISHRAVMLGAVAEGDTEIAGLLFSDDVLATAGAFREMGVEIERKGEGLLVKGRGPDALYSPRKAIDLGNSGTSMRLLAGLLAGMPVDALLIGDASLMKRPMKRVIEPLREMGADVGCSRQGTAPLMIRGAELRGIRYQTPVASAQIKSAILLAGISADGETWIKEPGPSRDHTERMLPAFGVSIKKDGDWIGIKGGKILKSPGSVSVPGDFSSAAYFLVAATIVPGSDLLIKDVGMNPTRVGLLDALIRMGADIEIRNRRDHSGEPVADLRVRHAELAGAEFGGEDIVRMIDELPVLAVAAARAGGATTVRDARELRVKESDRIEGTVRFLTGMGVKARESEDGFTVEGGGEPRGGTVECRLDHRIGMAAAVLALASSGRTVIKGAECIGTSFPDFHRRLTEVTR